MKLAVYGMMADGAGSGAGSFPTLLRALLERGHHVDVFGTKGFTEPRSLEGLAGYRFLPLDLRTLRRTRNALKRLPTRYPSAIESQLDHVFFHREAVRRIEAEHAAAHYDAVLCTDAQALFHSRLPLFSWPQSPPDSEGSALRELDVARLSVQNGGLGRYGAVQLFYAYRWLLARSAIDASDLYLCGSTWARDRWQRFGVPPERLRTLAYPVELDGFEAVPPLGQRPDGTVTFLWLGRAVPRKRLDLFLAAFELFHRREPRARARLVGQLETDPLASRLLGRYREHPAIRVDGVLPRARVPALLAEVDVLVQPSQNENFGFSVAEALAAGRPVVLGPTNGTADYAGGACHRFDEYRPEAVVEAMGRAFRAVTEAGPRVSTEARAAALEHFDVGRVAERFSALCSEALAHRGRPV